MSFSWAKMFFGRPLANREAEETKLGVFTGIPAMGLDGLGSASYGPEAALAILAVAGAAGLGHVGPIIWVILGLLAILFLSYRQTIAAYPNNGGSYVVAKENLGTGAGLAAAAALMVDYVLNVAVGISAGVGALTSAIPSLHGYTLLLCLGILVAITLVNLRGTKESGMAWSVPTYAFVGSLGFIVAWGSWKAFMGDGHPEPVIAPPAMSQEAGEAVTLWLLLRAFASGCTAMTGVEAVSNGVSAFREPTVKHAHQTLAAICAILGLLLLGIGYLAQSYSLMAMDQTKAGYQSVLSQLVGAVYGNGWFYYVAIGSVLCVLCLSANTSFVGFPRLCRLVAADGFLPRPFAVPGRRLVFSVGILFLSASAAALLIAFGGITDRLIPLFAVGAFLSFTLSQTGMAVHWRRALREGGGNRGHLAINGIGAFVTAIALAVILVAKFEEGAWLTVLIMPLTVLLLRYVRRYYDGVDRQVLQGSHREIDLRGPGHSVAIVPIKRWDRLTRRAVQYALRITPHVTAINVTQLEGPDSVSRDAQLTDEWRNLVEEPAKRAGIEPPRLLIVKSEFRSVVAPLLRVIQDLDCASPGCQITVVLPELVDGRWWGYLMHTNRERRLRARILRHGGLRVAIVSVPWQLQESDPAQAIAEEEEGEAPASGNPARS
ncbi:MAG: ydaO [Rubritepida sp.]|nr:ydaO [Rubritepida sp.]